MKLYEINEQIDNLLNEDFSLYCIDQDTGEILQDRVNELFNNLTLDRKEKIEAIGIYIKNMTAEVDEIKKEEKNLEARRRAKENRIEGLKRYVAENMKHFGDKKIETAKVVLSFRKSNVVEIPDIRYLDKQYIKEKIEYAPDKCQIKEILKNGGQVTGAVLVERENLQVK